MKICCLDQYFKTRDVAGGTRGYEMARLLVQRGFDVTVVTTGRTPSAPKHWCVSEVEGIEVHSVGIPYSNNMGFRDRAYSFFRFAVAAGGRAATVGGDVVFATSTPLTIALPAVWAKRRLNAAMVFEVRDLWPELPIAIGALRNPVFKVAARWLERFAYRNADRIVALSPGMKDGVAHTGYPHQRINVIPNSSDIELFSVPRKIGLGWRENHPEIGNRPMVLYAGTIGRMNGVDWLVKVAGVSASIHPDVCFVIVGDGAEREKVVRLAGSTGLLEKNLFVFPSLPKRDMPAVISAATICTSLFVDLEAMWHNSANKFFDALAGRRPVAINYGGWQAELLESTGAGMVLPVGDIPGAARLLLSKVDNDEWIRRASSAAGQLATERFDRKILACELADVLTAAEQDHRTRP